MSNTTDNAHVNEIVELARRAIADDKGVGYAVAYDALQGIWFASLAGHLELSPEVADELRDTFADVKRVIDARVARA